MRRNRKVRASLKKIIGFWKSIWGKLIAFIICGSIVALFIASFCLDKSLTLSVMNEWVSLVVGMAALILGIISLFLSFYNVEQSNEVQKDTIKIMNDVKNDITNRIDIINHKIDTGFSDYNKNDARFEGSIKRIKKEDWNAVEERNDVRR